MFPHWINIGLSFIAIFVAGIISIKKNWHHRAIMIFLVLFVIGQIIGYGMDINFLKVNTPYGDSGTSLSLVSIAIPLLLSFMIDYVVKSFKRTQK